MDERVIDWNAEFFYGENEAALLASTLNSILPQELERWRTTLNNFMDCLSANEVRVSEIVFDGCEDVILRLSDGSTLEISGLETTFNEVLGMLDQ